MLDTVGYLRLLTPGQSSDADGWRAIESVRFENPELAWKRLCQLASTTAQRQSLARAMPALLAALEEAATPDLSLVHLDQFLRSGKGIDASLAYLAEHPRAVEILVRLFVGSAYLTQVLLQNPGYLERLAQHNRLADVKSRSQFFDDGLAACQNSHSWQDALTELRRYQKWELLRIAACDAFGLLDFKSATLQLSLLADGMVQAILQLACRELRVDAADFCVLAMGKLGGEELNYSSDIDLVFVCEGDGSRYTALAQRLIRGLTDPSASGFFYRVDMRLRPWGRAGALVTSRESYAQYLRKEGRLWEKQALLKARPIAGNLELGTRTLQELRPIVYEVDPELARQNVLSMKREIESQLTSRGLLKTEVKNGLGGIRDIEFTTQYLQLIHGSAHPAICTTNTLDGIVRLADHDLIQADEYRQLTSGYVFLRTVEHSLQLLHNQQEHAIPKSNRELQALSRRIDFLSPADFLAYHEQHRNRIRRIFEKYLAHPEAFTHQESLSQTNSRFHGLPGYSQAFSTEQQTLHSQLLSNLSGSTPVLVRATARPHHRWEVTIVGLDEPGGLSVICGLLLARQLDIESGDVFTAPIDASKPGRSPFVDVLQVHGVIPDSPDQFWSQYQSAIQSHLYDDQPEARAAHQGRLARQVAELIEFDPESSSQLLPLEIEFDNTSDPASTILRISAEDTIGFLYELTNALTLNGIQIQRVTIRTIGQLASDTLFVTDSAGHKITDPRRLSELRAAVVLTKHFTHLLPQSPNPESALLRFRELVVRLFERPDWSEQVASLDRLEVLEGLSRLLGMSDFVGEELLKRDVDQLIPYVADSQHEPQNAKSHEQLLTELRSTLETAHTLEEKRVRLNDFKDRERLRVDLRHILGRDDSFTQFAQELTDIADVTVRVASEFCTQELIAAYGAPRLSDGTRCQMAVVALGKCGGQELGFASDIELMFLYEGTGKTDGRHSISNGEFFDRLVELFTKSIWSRRQGVFELDLRLRPHGRAGSPAVLVESFERYFGPAGTAWPYEKQALVKMRPIAGDDTLGMQIIEIRDRLVYTGQPFDTSAMRAIRDKQIRQLVMPGTLNAKLSPGGLVDIEYLIQGLQIQFGQRFPAVRSSNTRDAMKALEQCGVLTTSQRLSLRDAYRFFRRLIDAMRMVRGDARDLTVPPQGSEEFRFLARRMRLFKDSTDLAADLESYSSVVREISKELERAFTTRETT